MRTRGLLVLAAILMILGFENAKAKANLVDPYWNGEMPHPEGADANGSAGAASIEVKPTALVSAVASPLASQDKLFASAYFGALSILAASNECSDFFGGPAAAEVFTQLMGNVSKNSLPALVAMNMNGLTVQVTNARTKSKYRLFDKVLINSHGAFYRDRAPVSLAPLPGVGGFPANTNEVRVLMLLHELGHAIKGDDGKWLLPDDGKDSGLSRRNSQKIEDVCGRQIKALREQNLKHDALTAHESKND
jgi:hypothetical protein